MRIEGWHVDGFGVLHDQGVDGLGPGITVLLGENEAGKSTQFAFLRAVLFGLADRRTNEPPYEPLRGGAHGGVILLRDEQDGLWRVERHAGRSGRRHVLKVTRPDLTAGDEADLTALLRGVNGDLFRSVYAFDLTQLLTLDALDPNDKKGIRDRIFSQAIIGGGPTPKAVSDVFAKRMQELLKQGAGSAATVNQLARDIAVKEEQLRDARDQAETYAGLLEQERAQEAAVRTTAAALDALRLRQAHLAKLIDLQPALFESNDLAEELAKLPEGDELFPARVATLVDDLTALAALESQSGPRREERRSAEDGLEEALARLGADWSVERVRSFTASMEVRDELETWKEKLEAAEGSACQRDEHCREAVEAAQEHHADLERAECEMSGKQPPPQAETKRLQQVLIGLRSELQDLQLAEAQAAAAPPAPLLATQLSWAFAIAAAAGAAAIGVLVDWRLALGLAVAAVLFVVLGVVGRGHGSASPHEDGREAPSTEAGPVDRLKAGVAEAAADLGLPPRPSAAQLGAREAELAERLAVRIAWDARATRLDDLRQTADAASDKAEQAAVAATEAQQGGDELEKAWREWADAHDLSGLRPAAAVKVFDAVEAGRRADRSVLAAASRLDDIAASTVAWEARAREALVSVGIKVVTSEGRGEATALPADRSPVSRASGDALRSAVRTLHAQLVRRGEAAARLRDLQQQLERRLGPAEQAQAALAELGSGDADGWRTELDGLEERMVELQAQRDQAVEVRRVAHDARVELEESGSIPVLQAERASLLAELAMAVHEYRLLATAKRLVDDTFKQYARERQPEVLSEASHAFATVTRGAYVRLDPFDSEGAEGIVAVSADDEMRSSEQLSRGTREQLYVVMRLALASDLARRRTPPGHLPLVMDDCLVNFDPQRAEATARLLAGWALDAQCLLFTCHPETAELLLEASQGAASVVRLGRLGSSAAAPA
jgi:uncharacterized protein YhaN